MLLRTNDIQSKSLRAFYVDDKMACDGMLVK